MPIVRTIASLKGGVGKTTLTAAMAGELAERGKRVLILDCDANLPFQLWQNSEFVPREIDIAPISNSRDLLRAIALGKQEFDEILVDLPAGGSQLMVNAVAHSDVVCVPFRAAFLDVKEAIATRHVCFDISREFRKAPAFVVCVPMALTGLRLRERITREAVELLHSDPDLVATSGTTDRTAYRQLFNPETGGATLYTLPDTVTNIASSRAQIALLVSHIDDLRRRHQKIFGIDRGKATR